MLDDVESNIRQALAEEAHDQRPETVSLGALERGGGISRLRRRCPVCEPEPLSRAGGGGGGAGQTLLATS